MAGLGKITHVQLFQNQELLALVLDGKAIRMLCLKRLELIDTTIRLLNDE